MTYKSWYSLKPKQQDHDYVPLCEDQILFSFVIGLHMLCNIRWREFKKKVVSWFQLQKRKTGVWKNIHIYFQWS